MAAAEQALAEAATTTAKLLTQAPVNDPAAMGNVLGVARRTIALRRQAYEVAPPDDVLYEQLAEVAAALPVAARCSPGQTAILAEYAIKLLRTTITPGERERWAAVSLDDARRRMAQTLAGGPQTEPEMFPGRPGMRALWPLKAVEAPLYMYGSHPTFPAWPEAVHRLQDGEKRAREAYRDLHEDGWARAEDILVGDHNTLSFEEVAQRYDAARAFAALTAGPDAVHQLELSFRWAVWHFRGPAEALALPAPETWDSSDAWRTQGIKLLMQLCSDLIRLQDWDGAREAIRDARLRGDLTNADEEHVFASYEAMVAREHGPAPRKRPGRLATPNAPARPAEAQALVDAASAGDPAASSFLAASATARGRADLARNPDLSTAQLWLLFEYDDVTLNGHIAKHRAATEELLAAMVREGRHGKGGRPELSRHVTEAVLDKPELLPYVLAGAVDPRLINAALEHYGDLAQPSDLASLALRTLEFPQLRALSIMEAVLRHTRPEPALRELLELASHDAAGAIVDTPRLREALQAAAAQASSVAGRSEPQEAGSASTDASFIDQIVRVRKSGAVRPILRAWRHRIPWTDLEAAVSERRVEDEVALLLAQRPNAPTSLRRTLAASASELWLWEKVVGSGDAARWLADLLDEPRPDDPRSSQWRIALAASIQAKGPEATEIMDVLPSQERRQARSLAVRELAPLDEAADPTWLWSAVRSWHLAGEIDIWNQLKRWSPAAAVQAVRFLEEGVIIARPARTEWQDLPELIRRGYAAETNAMKLSQEMQALGRKRLADWPHSIEKLLFELVWI